MGKQRRKAGEKRENGQDKAQTYPQSVRPLDWYLRRYPYLAAHIIAESRGAIRAINAARMIRNVRDGLPYNERGGDTAAISDWLHQACQSLDAVAGLRRAIKNRDLHNKAAIVRMEGEWPSNSALYELQNPELSARTRLFHDAYARVVSAINSEEVYLTKFPRICAHIIIEGRIKVWSAYNAARELKAVKEAYCYEPYSFSICSPLKRDAAAVYSELFGYDVRKTVLDAIRNRHIHKRNIRVYRGAMREVRDSKYMEYVTHPDSLKFFRR